MVHVTRLHSTIENASGWVWVCMKEGPRPTSVSALDMINQGNRNPDLFGRVSLLIMFANCREIRQVRVRVRLSRNKSQSGSVGCQIKWSNSTERIGILEIDPALPSGTVPFIKAGGWTRGGFGIPWKCRSIFFEEREKGIAVWKISLSKCPFFDGITEVKENKHRGQRRHLHCGGKMQIRRKRKRCLSTNVLSR